jgi:hypothetical protein
VTEVTELMPLRKFRQWIDNSAPTEGSRDGKLAANPRLIKHRFTGAATNTVSLEHRAAVRSTRGRRRPRWLRRARNSPDVTQRTRHAALRADSSGRSDEPTTHATAEECDPWG